MHDKLLYPVSFCNRESSIIKITAPFNCWVEVTHTFLGWGYAGGLYTFSIIESDSDLVKATFVGDTIAGCQGGDITNKFLCSKAVFKNLKKDNTYSFQKQDIAGGAGVLNNRRFLVICYPE